MSQIEIVEEETIVQQQEVLSARARFWRRFRRQNLAMISFGFIIFLIIVAIIGPAITPYSPFDATPNISSPPSREHPLGTDTLGRDNLSRVILGARISMMAAIQGVGLAALIGVPIGLLSGYLGGTFDRVVVWVNDIFYALPTIILGFAIVAVLGPSLTNVIIAIAIAISTRYIRLSRAVVLEEREQLYVDGARVGGVKTPVILFKHILPNVAPPLVVQTSLLFGAVLLTEASLSFLGLGTSLEQPSWGRMLASARDTMAINAWPTVPPGISIALTVLAFNLLGDGLRDALGRDITQRSQGSTAARKRRAQEAPVSLSDYETPPSPEEPVVSIRNLEVRFPTPTGSEITIIHDVSLDIYPGKTLGLVGESGSGKSMTALAALNLIPRPGWIENGSVLLDGKDLSKMPRSELRRLRGNEISIIFQEPYASLNPAFTVGNQIVEMLQVHTGISKAAARKRAIELLSLVRVPDPHRRVDEYPHQFSGGMAQRVGIARAIACNPKFLIADEPTTALDVTVQGQILQLLKDLQAEFGMAMLFITHDLGVVAELCDRAAVMYAGEIVEKGKVEDLFASPQHPYTKALLSTSPHNGRGVDGKLPVIRGMVPPPNRWPSGCRFHPRCDFATEECSLGTLQMKKIAPGRQTRCIRIEDIDLNTSRAVES